MQTVEECVCFKDFDAVNKKLLEMSLVTCIIQRDRFAAMSTLDVDISSVCCRELDIDNLWQQCLTGFIVAHAIHRHYTVTVSLNKNTHICTCTEV